MSNATNERLWTPADLAQRWGCSVGTVMDRVRTKGLAVVWLGPGEAKLTGRGAKLVRFRPETVAQWEAAQEKTWAEAEAPAASPRKAVALDILGGKKARRSGA